MHTTNNDKARQIKHTTMDSDSSSPVWHSPPLLGLPSETFGRDTQLCTHRIRGDVHLRRCALRCRLHVQVQALYP